MAPERLKADNYSILAEVWSLGLMLMELAIGRYPVPLPSVKEFQAIFESDQPSK
jgi:hypothetical protein